MKTLPPPPEKLHDLLALALHDYDIVQQDLRYKIHMGCWHAPAKYDDDITVCCVCLAGCVMAGTFKADITKTLWPQDFDIAWSRALDSLDSLRCGFHGTSIRFPVGNSWNLPRWRADMQHFLEYLQLQDL